MVGNRTKLGSQWCPLFHFLPSKLILSSRQVEKNYNRMTRNEGGDWQIKFMTWIFSINHKWHNKTQLGTRTRQTPEERVQGCAKKFLLSSVGKVPFRLMGSEMGCLGQWAEVRRENSNVQELFCMTLYRNDADTSDSSMKT